jgi:hypothetical protein
MGWIALAQDETFGFDKILGNSCVAKWMVVSREGIDYMESVCQLVRS